MKRLSLTIALSASAACIAALAFAACVQGTDATVGTHLAVATDANSCTVSAHSAPRGNVSFTVTNSGSQVTEFYVLGDDGVRIAGEIENIGPSLSRDLTLTLEPGNYFTECKPGMVGDDVGKAAFTVVESNVAAPRADEKTIAATTNYLSYVRKQVSAFASETTNFLNAFNSGDTQKAQQLYPRTRAFYERIEPLAESFGKFDQLLDAREADQPDPTQWTGWHRIEKDLWPPALAPAQSKTGGAAYTPLTSAQRAQLSAELTKNTLELAKKVADDSFTISIDDISNGASSLMDEVATSKVTGEEEVFSHTDLWDFAANIEGARIAYEAIRPVLDERDPSLAARLNGEFTAVSEKLAPYGNSNAGFVPYTNLTQAQTKELSDEVNAVSEPLSQVTAKLVGA